MSRFVPRHLLLPVLLLIGGCAVRPADHPASGQPATDAPSPAVPDMAPDWLPLHPNARPGDWVIHYRLTPDGMTRLQRRTEVVARGAGRIELRRTLGDGRGAPRRVLRLTVAPDGRVLAAHREDHPDRALRLDPGSRRQTRLEPPEPLELVSGRFRIDHVVTRRSARAGTAVYYLSAAIPFGEVVSLTARERYRTRDLVKLLGHIAVPDSAQPDDKQPAAGSAIHGGWLLMHWGRGGD